MQRISPMSQGNFRTRQRPSCSPSTTHLRRKARVPLLMLPLVLLTAAACTTSSKRADPSDSRPTQAASSASTDAGSIEDPLSAITSKDDEAYVADSVQPLLHTNGAGPSRFEISASAETKGVRVYLACAPDSEFSVQIGKGFSGSCSKKFENWADIPVEPGSREVNVKIPDSTKFIILVIPTPI